jgi:hypothetical protein
MAFLNPFTGELIASDPTKANKTYVDTKDVALQAQFDASTYYHELHVNFDYTGGGSTGSPYKPFTTIQAAINAAQTQNVGGNTAILIHLKKDITITENLVVNNAVTNLYIAPFVPNNTDSSPLKILGSLTISGSQTNRVRLKDLNFTPTSGYALIIDGSNGRHMFQNCQFSNGSIAGLAGTGVNLTNTYKNFIEFIDCTIEGTVNIAGTPNAGTAVTFYRPRLTYANLIVNSANVSVGVFDCYGIYGITHTAGALAITGLWGFSSVGFFNSTANLTATNFLTLSNVSLQKLDLSFVNLNKTGTCYYQLMNVHRNETNDTLNGTRTVYGPTATDAGYKMAVTGNWSTQVYSVGSALDVLASSKIPTSQKGAANGVAPLDGSAKISSTYLPSYVDDVLEYANLASFPVTGETGKIYIALDTNKCYRWSGSAYIYITSGAVDSVNGKTGVVVLTKADIGLSNVDNTSDLNKPISTATATALAGKEPLISSGNISQYWRGDKTWQTLDKSAVGLSNVDNTSDINKPISSATQTALNAKENVANKTTDGTLSANSDTLYPSEKAVKTYVDGIIYNQDLITKEPTGFATRADSTMSFNNTSRIFTIQPTGASFDFYVKGQKFTKSTAQTVTIPNLAGTHYIYFDSAGTLNSTQAFSSSLITDNAFVSNIYWNTDTQLHTYFAEERHGLVMDGETHAYLHTAFGARYISGLALQNFTIGNGNSDADAQWTVDSGSIRDEDLLLSSVAQAQIPILYRQGQYWRKKTADAFPMIYNGTAGYTGTRPAYNQYTGGAWQLTEMPNTSFILMHFFATNDIENPVIGIPGTSYYNNLSAARTGAIDDISNLSGLPFAEFVAIGSVIIQSNNYSNIPRARVVRTDTGANYVDFRGTQPYAPAGQASDHGLLSGLTDDDHLQYHTDARGDIRYYPKSQSDAALVLKENTITAGTTSQYWRGDKTWQTLDKTAAGLGNVDNTSDVNKPISSATQTALNNKENLSNKSTDGTFFANSDTLYPSQKAAKTYVDTSIVNAAGDGLKQTSGILSVDAFQELLTLSATDITNQYVDLSYTAINATIILIPAGGIPQLTGVDFTLSVVSGKTRISFAGDIATGGVAALISGDKLAIQYIIK